MARYDMPGYLKDEPDPLPDPVRIGVSDLHFALAAGWRDFRRAPAFGLLFSAFYVLGGLALVAVATAVGSDWWLIPFILGFPLIAPFAAVGLYEVSRRIELGQELDWRSVSRIVIAQKDRQIPSMAMVILLMFMFWVFVAHTIFAIFLGTASLTNVTSSTAILFQGRGLAMLAIGTLIGAGFALALFSFTVVGLPLLLDYETDFVTAITTSIKAVRLNFGVLTIWGAVIAALILAAILPAFLGLLIVLPVLGHATWHLYRRLMPDLERDQPWPV